VSEGRNAKLPSILICSDERGLGSETLARAISSSLGIPLKTTFGDSLKFDVNLQEFLQDASDDAAFYISDAEKLSPNMQHVLYRVLKDKMLRLTGYYGQPPQHIPFNNKLIILGTTSEISIVPALLYLFDLRVSLTSYSTDMIIQILKQRIQFLGWQIESELILDYIASEANGNPSKAVRKILQMSYVIARSEGQDVIKMEHVHTAIKLDRSEDY